MKKSDILGLFDPTTTISTQSSTLTLLCSHFKLLGHLKLSSFSCKLIDNFLEKKMEVRSKIFFFEKSIEKDGGLET